MTTCNRDAIQDYQLQSSDPNGGVNCLAYSTAMAIDYATCGAKQPTGRQIRALSNEPKPDPKSPGLNLYQMEDVARDHYGVALDLEFRLPWAEYEARRARGMGCILQLDYSPIKDSPLRGSKTFGAGHGIFESVYATHDPLADGRAPGIWKYDGRVYPRSLIREAAGELVIGTDRSGHPVRVGHGYVYAAFTRDVTTDTKPSTWRMTMSKGSFFDYEVRAGKIRSRSARSTGGFSAPCSRPQTVRSAAGVGLGSHRLIHVQDGAFKGAWVDANGIHVTLKEIPG